MEPFVGPTTMPPICEGCQHPMTPYAHDPLRWWVCTRCWKTQRRG